MYTIYNTIVLINNIDINLMDYFKTDPKTKLFHPSIKL